MALACAGQKITFLQLQTSIIWMPFTIRELSNPRYQPWLTFSCRWVVATSLKIQYQLQFSVLIFPVAWFFMHHCWFITNALTCSTTIIFAFNGYLFALVQFFMREFLTRWLVLSSIWWISYIWSNFEPVHSGSWDPKPNNSHKKWLAAKRRKLRWHVEVSNDSGKVMFATQKRVVMGLNADKSSHFDKIETNKISNTSTVYYCI
jgi:small-conductance mechanosensitive channel